MQDHLSMVSLINYRELKKLTKGLNTEFSWTIKEMHVDTFQIDNLTIDNPDCIGAGSEWETTGCAFVKERIGETEVTFIV